ncbi:hypothetical protein [Marivita sp.]|uniref:hypothetical protein n=1 Tax=Marivita sp. TaxID=2003365 RepID=UPI0025C67173|nr:hypothetical protein [Marivita sp.]
MNPPDTITNQPFDSLKPGDGARIERRVSVGDMRGFTTHAADITDHGIDRKLASDPDFRAALAQGGFAVTLLVTLIIGRFPGPGTRLDTLSVECSGVLKQGDMPIAEATVASLDAKSRKVQLDCRCCREDGTVILAGRIGVIVPDRQVSRPFGRQVALEPGHAPDGFEHIEDLARDMGPVRMAVVNPVDAPSIEGAISSARAGLIEPVLFGAEKKIRTAAEEARVDLSGVDIRDTPVPEQAPRAAARLAAARGAWGAGRAGFHRRGRRKCSRHTGRDLCRAWLAWDRDRPAGQCSR